MFNNAQHTYLSLLFFHIECISIPFHSSASDTQFVTPYSFPERALAHRNWIDNSRFDDFVHIINRVCLFGACLGLAHRKLIMCWRFAKVIWLVWIGNKRHFYVVTFSRNFWLLCVPFGMIIWNSAHILLFFAKNLSNLLWNVNACWCFALKAFSKMCHI